LRKQDSSFGNGPLGKYEDGFGGGTEKLVKIIAKSKAFSIVGGETLCLSFQN